MTRVLRLGVNARVELFNGTGDLLQGCIQSIDRNGSDIVALEESRVLCPEGIRWHIFAAFGTLKGGRADWLIEKCTELGASSITPLLTERSTTISDSRVDRSAATQDDSQPSHEASQFSSICFPVKTLISSSCRIYSSCECIALSKCSRQWLSYSWT